MRPSLRVHVILNRSRANGPGTRCVIWFQGCSLGCPGCFNPETHAQDNGRSVEVEEVVGTILDLQGQLEGITISGGEPLQQVDGLIELLKAIRERTSLSVVLFSGYTLKEVECMARAKELLALIDVLIAGRYNASLRVAKGLIGSSNKVFHFLTDRYTQADFDSIPEKEITIQPDGTVIRSGIGWDLAR